MLLLDQAAQRNGPPIASYFLEIGETQLLSQEDEQDLARRVQEGDVEARDEMVKANLRLVVAIARRFVGRGLGLSDLIQEGNLGLVHAVERFDPAQNTRFSTYAKFWIKEAIGEGLEKTAGPVRLSGYANGLMSNWRKAANELHNAMGRNPTDEEIGARLQLTKRQIAIVQKAQRIQQGASHVAPQDGIGAAADTLVDSRCSQPGAGLTADDEMRHVLELVDKLPHRAATVLRLRYGLSEKEPMTLHEIGQQLALTRERVRQIEKHALARLRDLIE
jgi:RNA polymerase primary sigma factor